MRDLRARVAAAATTGAAVCRAAVVAKWPLATCNVTLPFRTHAGTEYSQRRARLEPVVVVPYKNPFLRPATRNTCLRCRWSLGSRQKSASLITTFFLPAVPRCCACVNLDHVPRPVAFLERHHPTSRPRASHPPLCFAHTATHLNRIEMKDELDENFAQAPLQQALLAFCA